MTPNLDAKDAIEKARIFLEDYHSSFSLKSTILEEDVWIIICDVGFLNVELKEVKIDASTGKVLGFRDVSPN